MVKSFLIILEGKFKDLISEGNMPQLRLINAHSNVSTSVCELSYYRLVLLALITCCFPVHACVYVCICVCVYL